MGARIFSLGNIIKRGFRKKGPHQCKTLVMETMGHGFKPRQCNIDLGFARTDQATVQQQSASRGAHSKPFRVTAITIKFRHNFQKLKMWKRLNEK